MTPSGFIIGIILKIKFCLNFLAFSWLDNKNYVIPLQTNEETD